MSATSNYSSLDTFAPAEWERPLLARAHTANLGPKKVKTEATVYTPPSEPLLEQAYAYCRSLTAFYSRSFFFASRLLPSSKRQAVRALYAFCRTTDDIVDHPAADTSETLRSWRERSLRSKPPRDDLVIVAWADTLNRYQIPVGYAEQLIEGVARDLYQTRYQTFAELANYCYGVASTVGLMCMHIIGFRGEEAVRYAIRLGVALQLTNILRDVAEDWRNGRLYLPLTELAAFGLREADLDRQIVTGRWREFMRFQIARTRRLYRESLPGILLLEQEGRLAILAAADFYGRILDDIEAHDYDVFTRRAHVTGWGKLRRLPQLWWQASRLSHPPGKKSLSTGRQWVRALGDN